MFSARKCFAPSSPAAWFSVCHAKSLLTVSLLQPRVMKYAITSGLVQSANAFVCAIDVSRHDGASRKPRIVPLASSSVRNLSGLDGS
ncbi:protein of unknown function [Shinella sp. WSC3-e]|nr:protein of unknown function [Shinella sp. WSC3-e]